MRHNNGTLLIKFYTSLTLHNNSDKCWYCWYYVSLLRFSKYKCWMYTWTKSTIFIWLRRWNWNVPNDKLPHYFFFDCVTATPGVYFMSILNFFFLCTTQDFGLLCRIDHKPIDSILNSIEWTQPFVEPSSSHFFPNLLPYSSQSFFFYWNIFEQPTL